ncbi:ATP-dependent metallopeptidase FtsH/Yme1/Tma family protein [Prochlorococcus sp. MIT 1314]|uniref:ATP-dependent metallopeptidase FtsH/Yme1/Tma family protein n=1 Tax=Prochlorococcus sp. MIT 1314 TaxID=3096220 RepID=UPI002A75FBBD|nr:ATP-dependent metallopeptidase FtsH/Yme1/Tma family protein [Prochlorococcus sp. MIT 1314]
MNKFLTILIFGIIFLLYRKINSKKTKNIKLNKFKNKLQSTQTNIERIFLREEEKTFSNPNINIFIGIYDKEDNIKRKSNIHRARLSKFSKSKLNGEMIFRDDEQRIYKFVNGEKVYL